MGRGGGKGSYCLHNGIRGCAADLSMVLITFGIALGNKLRELGIVLGHKMADLGIDLGQKRRKPDGF